MYYYNSILIIMESIFIQNGLLDLTQYVRNILHSGTDADVCNKQYAAIFVLQVGNNATMIEVQCRAIFTRAQCRVLPPRLCTAKHFCHLFLFF